jgi:hypothetical protein
MRRSFTFFYLPLLIFFFGCHYIIPQKELSEKEQSALINKGKEIVQQSFKSLSTELQTALQAGGVQKAISYCHLQASPIIDSLSSAYNVKIFRVSDRHRNPGNQPDELDITVMAAYQKQLAEGRELQAHLETTGTETIFYAPIVIQNPMCLLCHGQPGNAIQQADYELLLSKYPQDLATGYKLGDLRGLWKIRFSE